MFKVIFTSNVIGLRESLKAKNAITKISTNSFHTQFQILFSKESKTAESERMKEFKKKLRERTPIENLEELEEGKHPYQEKEPLKSFPNDINPETVKYTNNGVFELGLSFNRLNTDMFNSPNKIAIEQLTRRSRKFVTSVFLRTKKLDLKDGKEESTRMKQFHKKLKLQPIPRVPPKERFVDLVLVETDPESGELMTNTEKDPTKWGDWQNGGRVSDF